MVALTAIEEPSLPDVAEAIALIPGQSVVADVRFSPDPAAYAGDIRTGVARSSNITALLEIAVSICFAFILYTDVNERETWSIYIQSGG